MWKLQRITRNTWKLEVEQLSKVWGNDCTYWYVGHWLLLHYIGISEYKYCKIWNMNMYVTHIGDALLMEWNLTNPHQGSILCQNRKLWKHNELSIIIIWKWSEEHELFIYIIIIICLSVHYDARTWFLSKFYFRHISKNSAEFNILVMNMGYGLFYLHLLYVKALHQKLSEFCILVNCRIINWCFGRAFWVGRLVFELFYLTRNAAPAALRKKLILCLMWTLVNSLSARVVEFGYYVALDQSQSSIWFKEFEIIVLESNFMNVWHSDLPNISKASGYEYL